MNHSGSSVSVAGDSRITPFGAKLRHWKIDELPELWDVFYEDEMISAYVAARQAAGDGRDAQTIAVEYNDTVIYPDKVRLNRRTKQDQSQACLSYGLQGGGKPKVNKYYYGHYSFWKDLEMIFATVLGRKVRFGGEEI